MRGEKPLGAEVCTNCGSNLAEPCSRCGEMTLAGQRFCGGCGAEVAVTIWHQVEQIETDLRKVDNLLDKKLFEEALTLLLPISKLTHPRLVPHAAVAGKRSGTSLCSASGPSKRLSQLSKRDADGWPSTITLRDQGDPRIPEQFRSPEMKARLEQALACDRELAALAVRCAGHRRQAVRSRAQGRVAVAGVATAECGRLDRSAHSLRKKFRRLAEEKLGQYQYEQALKYIEQIPHPLWTAETANSTGGWRNGRGWPSTCGRPP